MLWAAPEPGMTGATAIVARILVARHLKTADALFRQQAQSPRTKSMTNPDDSLVRLYPNEGIQFSTWIEIALTISIGVDRHKYRQKMNV